MHISLLYITLYEAVQRWQGNKKGCIPLACQSAYHPRSIRVVSAYHGAHLCASGRSVCVLLVLLAARWVMNT